MQLIQNTLDCCFSRDSFSEQEKDSEMEREGEENTQRQTEKAKCPILMCFAMVFVAIVCVLPKITAEHESSHYLSITIIIIVVVVVWVHVSWLVECVSLDDAYVLSPSALQEPYQRATISGSRLTNERRNDWLRSHAAMGRAFASSSPSNYVDSILLARTQRENWPMGGRL